MSQEIVYTSALRGLKSNASGFCTVLSTNGMARNLSERLESLSGYRFHFPAHDANAHLNPVNYSHLKMTVGGEPFQVLSRICDAGLDHTRRSNKLAHHIAFKAREIKPTDGSSPAWTLAAPGFCETEWEGEPRLVAEGRKRLPESQRSPQPATVWKSLAGDAGWAAVLAESALQHPPRPMHVIFPAGTDTLSLVVEALHLLPAKDRWDVTFSTYFTKLEAGTECQWRFVLDGTQEAKAVRLDPHKPKIDLGSDLGPAPDGNLVEFARTGLPTASARGESPPLAAPTTVEHTAEPADDRQPANAHAERAATRESPDTERLITAPPRSSTPAPVRRERPPRRLPLPWIIAGSLLLFLLITGGMIAAFVGGRGFGVAPEQLVENDRLAKSDTPEAKGDTPKKVVMVDAGLLESVEKPAEPPLPSLEPVVEEEKASPKEMAKVDEQPPSQYEPGPLPRHPLVDVIGRNNCLPLPSLARGGLPGSSYTQSETKLATIHVNNPGHIALDVIGDRGVLESGVEFDIDPPTSEDSSTRFWAIREKSPNAVGPGTAVGMFRLRGHDLTFQWDRHVKWEKLHYCWLRIDVNGVDPEGGVISSLIKAEQAKPFKLDFDSIKHEIPVKELKIPEGLHLSSARDQSYGHLKIDVMVDGIRESRYRVEGPTEALNFGDTFAVEFFDADTGEPGARPLIRVDAQFTSNEPKSGRMLVLRNSVYADAVKYIGVPSNDEPQPIALEWKSENYGRSVADLKRKTRKDELGQLSAEKQKFQKWIPILRQKLQDSRESQEQNEIKAAEASLEDAERRRRDYQQALKMLNNLKRWKSRVEGLYDKLEDNLEIRYRVYYEFEGNQADLLWGGDTGLGRPTESDTGVDPASTISPKALNEDGDPSTDSAKNPGF